MKEKLTVTGTGDALFVADIPEEYFAGDFKEVKAYLRGEYGKAPGNVDPELIKKVWGDEEIITCRFADTLEPAFDTYKAEIGEVARSTEDILSYIAFPTNAEKFFASREEKESNTVNYTIEKKED